MGRRQPAELYVFVGRGVLVRMGPNMCEGGTGMGSPNAGGLDTMSIARSRVMAPGKLNRVNLPVGSSGVCGSSIPELRIHAKLSRAQSKGDGPTLRRFDHQQA